MGDTHAKQCLVFDIETAEDLAFTDNEEYQAEIRAGCKAPASYKDEAKIAKKEAELYESAKSKFALHAYSGRIISMAWGWLHEDELHSVASPSEDQILELFAARLPTTPSILSGWNIREFDLPFLGARCAIKGIELPWWWPRPRDYRLVAEPRDWCTTGRLDLWLRAFGIEPKTARGDAVDKMPLKEVESYNREDVDKTRRLVRRMQTVMPQLHDVEPYDEVVL